MRNTQEEPQYIDKSLLLLVEPNDPLTRIPRGTGTIVIIKPDDSSDYKPVETLWLNDIDMIGSLQSNGNKLIIKLNEPIHSLNQASLLALMHHRQIEGNKIRFETNPELPQTATSELKKLAKVIKSLITEAA